ncbi:kinase-like protein [Gigaspora margarita]|uniref:Kinase-like protein n=1 Tax=Gigaspora margarita TaxID=4874 RepID=A0A8H4AVQ0_GIGMA|nr:kinase-like protein [Gigaspora margarita]
MSGKEFFDAAADILTVYSPVIGAVNVLVDEICKISENAVCFKEICRIMADRVKAAEYSIDKIIRNIERKKEDFLDKSYYLTFERFKNNLTQIKEFCKNVSKLKAEQRFLHATDVKKKFEQLRDDLDRCIVDLNFAFDVSNAIDRAEESQRVDTSLNEVKELLKRLYKLDEVIDQVDDKHDDGFKQVCDKTDVVAQRKEFFDAADDILTAYIPVIDAAKSYVEEIYQIYENAECNKELCAVMVGRVKSAEFSINKIVKNIEKKGEFNNKSYYLAFERLKNHLSRIKEYCKTVSRLKGYKRFLLATDVKNKFGQLRDDFDRCMTDLNFAVDVSNAIDKEEETQRVDESLKEIKELLKRHHNLDEATKKIDTSELDDPKKPIIRGKVFKKMYKSLIEVACKPIDGQNKNEMAILGKLGLSPQILKFHGHSTVNNSPVMILEWAELGNLKDLYEKHDIPWTRKIQIAKDILLGLLFLRTENVFHHDVRCENVFVLKDLSVKLGNFGFAREVDSNSRNLSSLFTYIVRWMAPELIKKYISQSHDEYKRIYTFNCEMFSFGMLLWELCYEMLPYAEWNTKQISDHVLSGKREKILKGKFANPDDKEIQLEFIKIIQDAWCHQSELRITIPALRQRLEELANKFPIHLDEPPLLAEGELDLDGLKSGVLEIIDIPEIEEEVPKDIEESTVISLKDGIDMHIKKEYKSAWEFFKQNAELNNPVAKFWVGHYLFYGLHGEKDPIQARKYFKEAADENNHAELQCRYSILLNNDLAKETDEAAKKQLREEIIRYFELAANNPENRNVNAMYYLGDIYVAGKLKVKKDEERGLNYLRLAANGNNERAIALLKMLGK